MKHNIHFCKPWTCRSFTFLYENFMQLYVFRFNLAFCVVMLCLYCYGLATKTTWLGKDKVMLWLKIPFHKHGS